ncbi:hypothetical protein IWW37_005309 [Coemansia sp. RSA 2050]|nr:hypothetical protein IWW37_005309 [Coemansia sp. RSA 2050]KAJ2730362.1 hypothetical protein IW152_005292 [Coemansia sp. BCRC 34962]
MNSAVWTRAVGTALTTLENALLEGGTTSTHITGNSGPGLIRKHTQKASSDTISDIEIAEPSTKRRRESASSTPSPPVNSDTAKPSSKSRKVSAALSSQFARSLSMSNGSDGFVGSSCTAAAPTDVCLESTGVDDPPLSFTLSSSSSSSSSPPWHTPGPDYSSFSTRVMVHPAANRSSKAREKSRLHADGLGLYRDARDQQSPQLGTDMDSSMTGSRTSFLNADSSSSYGGGVNGRAATDENIFTELLRPLVPPLDCILDTDSVHAAVQRWAVEAQAYISDEPPTTLVELVDHRISRLKELLPGIIGHLSGYCSSPNSLLLQHGELLRELCRAICEAACIGEWLLQRRFRLLPLFFPTLINDFRAQSMLYQATKMARVCDDMYGLVQWSPNFSPALSDMATELEEVVHAKHALYGDIVSQGGLAWKAVGLPVDSALLARVKQWMESVSDLCLSRIAHVYERRAKSSLAYNDEMLSAESLLYCSIQVLNSTALCVSMCGESFPNLAPQAMYIAGECTLWISNKFKPPPSAPAPALQLTSNSRHTCRKPDTLHFQGKQLNSRAMRLLAACESILRLLLLTKAVIVGNNTSSVFDLNIRIDHTDSVSGALETLATSLVEFSWTLAETLAAFRADGQAANPSGTMVLFADSVAKFARRIVEFGGSRKTAMADIRQHLLQIQGSVDTLSRLYK